MPNSARLATSNLVRSGFLVIMRTAPASEPEPNSVPCGPRRNSTRSTSNRLGSMIVELPFAEIGSRSEEHTSDIQSLMRITYAVFCLNKRKHKKINVQLLQAHTHSYAQIR